MPLTILCNSEYSAYMRYSGMVFLAMGLLSQGVRQ
jgi:hypothetical protein